MNAEGIEYSFLKRTENDGPFEEVIDYLLKVPCVNRPDILDYVFRLYRYSEHLFITDMFPMMYADDPKCFKRFTSHDGYSVNMRKLSVCCLRIFVNDFLHNDPEHVMVVSGSYAPGEEEQGSSRKLRLYWYFFAPLLDELGLEAILLPTWNAFLLARTASVTDKTTLENTYIKVKTQS